MVKVQPLLSGQEETCRQEEKRRVESLCDLMRRVQYREGRDWRGLVGPGEGGGGWLLPG